MPDRGPSPETCRLDVWLWRARFVGTRGDGGALAETGRLRLRRGGVESRPDKAGKAVRVGDELVFAMAGRVKAVRIAALGWRRGPPAEARALWTPLDGFADTPTPEASSMGAIDKSPDGLKNTAAPPERAPRPCARPLMVDR